MPISRTERLLNLLIALLGTRYGHSKEFLRRNVRAYRESPSNEAFERMFERDKADLRSLGIPLESKPASGGFEEDLASTVYSVPQEKYRLPTLRFTLAESAVLSLAGRLWSRAALGGSASSAMRKLDLMPIHEQQREFTGLEPRVSTREAAFADALEAVARRREVTFDYLGPGSAGVTHRRVQPWGLGLKYGHWYLVAWDLERDGERFFRLSRMVSTMVGTDREFRRPSGFSVTEALKGLERSGDQETAQLWVRKQRGQNLRKRGMVVESREGWDRLEMGFSSLHELASEVASFGEDVRVLSPEILRQEVCSRLDETWKVHMEPLPPLPPELFADWDHPVARQTSSPRSTAQDRLRRLVDLVPFLVRHQGLHLDVIAREFGITRRQLEADLSLLMVSGLPGGLHGDLMDVTWDDGHVFIADAEELSETIRLSVDEAAALLVGLQALSTVPGLEQHAAISSALSKLSVATGETSEDFRLTVGVHLSLPEQKETIERLHKAIYEKRQLRLRYLVPTRDEVSQRLVDPIRLFSHNDAWYLQAWCHNAEAERVFKLDRILALEFGKFQQKRPESIAPFPEEFFPAARDGVEVEVLVDARGLWVAEYYEQVRSIELPQGTLPQGKPWLKLLRLRVRDSNWLPRLIATGGGGIRLVTPEYSVEEVRRWCRAALEGYEGGLGERGERHEVSGS